MGKPFNVFISWSGVRAKHVAAELKAWLPMVLQTARPWMSELDIDKGARSLQEISAALEGAKVGIICLTPESLDSRWIMYEAGALSKTLGEKPRLCTYLLGGLQSHEVKGPLSMFHATRAEKEETRKLIHAINKAITDEPLPEERLNVLFDRMWEELEKKLTTMPQPESVVSAKRPAEEMLAEILELCRHYLPESRPYTLAMSVGQPVTAPPSSLPSNSKTNVLSAKAADTTTSPKTGASAGQPVTAPSSPTANVNPPNVNPSASQPLASKPSASSQPSQPPAAPPPASQPTPQPLATQPPAAPPPTAQQPTSQPPASLPSASQPPASQPIPQPLATQPPPAQQSTSQPPASLPPTAQQPAPPPPAPPPPPAQPNTRFFYVKQKGNDNPKIVEGTRAVESAPGVVTIYNAALTVGQFAEVERWWGDE